MGFIMDFALVAVIGGFFALAALYARACGTI